MKISNSLSRKAICMLLLASVAFWGCKKTSQSSSAAINWVTLDQAMAMNKQNNKKIYLFIYTDWCTWCHKFDSATLGDPGVAAYINNNYYAVRLNPEASDTIRINGNAYLNPSPGKMWSANKFAIMLLDSNMKYPASVFLDGNGNRLAAPEYGYISVKDFKPILSLYSSTNWKASSSEEHKKSL